MRCWIRDDDCHKEVTVVYYEKDDSHKLTEVWGYCKEHAKYMEKIFPELKVFSKELKEEEFAFSCLFNKDDKLEWEEYIKTLFEKK